MEKDRRIIEKIGGRREKKEMTKKKRKRREEGEYQESEQGGRKMEKNVGMTITEKKDKI